MSELKKFPHHFETEQFQKLLSPEEIDKITEIVAQGISKDYHGKEIVLVSMLKGGLMFLSDLVRGIDNVKLSIDFVHVGKSDSSGSLCIQKDISLDVKDKHVLLVKEVLDAGKTVHFFMERLKLSKPKSLEVVCLFDKPQKRKIDLTPKYTGKTLENQFIVGHGLDLDQFGRNIKGVYYLQYPN